MSSLQLSIEHKAVIGYADFNQKFSNASVMSTNEIPQDTATGIKSLIGNARTDKKDFITFKKTVPHYYSHVLMMGFELSAFILKRDL